MHVNLTIWYILTKIMKEIKIGKVLFCCRQLAIELTAHVVCMGRKLCQYNYISGQKYSCPGMTLCPNRLDQLLVQWPIDSKKHLANLYSFHNLYIQWTKDIVCQQKYIVLSKITQSWKQGMWKTEDVFEHYPVYTYIQ